MLANHLWFVWRKLLVCDKLLRVVFKVDLLSSEPWTSTLPVLSGGGCSEHPELGTFQHLPALLLAWGFPALTCRGVVPPQPACVHGVLSYRGPRRAFPGALPSARVTGGAGSVVVSPREPCVCGGVCLRCWRFVLNLLPSHAVGSVSLFAVALLWVLQLLLLTAFITRFAKGSFKLG